MRIWLEILQFELRQQLKSPFTLVMLPVFFLIHFLAMTSTGINLWAHPQADINSAYAIAVTESTLAIFYMLPVVVIVAGVILRDPEWAMASLIFSKPISKQQYLLGRLSAACLLAVVVGVAGLSGSLVGTLAPWIDQDRVAAFSMAPFLFCLIAVVVPNALIQCALFFSTATVFRSLSAMVVLAMVLLIGGLVLVDTVLDKGGGGGGLAVADHTGTLIVALASRNLTVAELNVLLPQSLVLENRLVWMGLSLAVLAWSIKRFRFDSLSGAGARARKAKAGESTRMVRSKLRVTTTASSSLQLLSQLRMDVVSIARSPVFIVILALGVIDTISQFDDKASPLMNLPLHPITSVMLGFFRFGLVQFVLLIALYYSAALLHREKESAIGEIVGAAPIPDWLLPIAKMLALSAVIALMLLVTMLTSIALQLMDGASDIELGLYLRVVFVNNGFYFWMLCVLAVTVQSVVSNKWLGMLLVFVLYVGLLSLPALGFGHVLYRFEIPYSIYSDMNGFGYIVYQTASLIAYWAFGCALLLICAYVLYARGVHASFKERLRDAALRFDRAAAVTVAVAIGFAVTGAWVFYNTNILNRYSPLHDVEQAQVDYEIKYGQYENRPTPSFVTIDLAVDLFPADRRMTSGGTAVLRNNKSVAIEEFVVSVDRGARVQELLVDSSTLKSIDVEQGFYLFSLHEPLQPGSVTKLTWKMERHNRGFRNAEHDTELVENGTFLSGLSLLPVPGFNEGRKLTDNATRRKWGLPPATRLAKLGDPAFLDKLAFGIDGPSEFRTVVSTDGDQTAVAPGKLMREWEENGRRYFEYASERALLPAMGVTSARYQVARDVWNDVALEVYYDPKHPYNVDAMIATARESLDYFTREFSPYPLSYFRIMEYPRYRTAARAFPGMVPYSEAAGFVADLSSMDHLDYATIHELSHMWWGGQAYGARMQGRELLNEMLAQYSTLMVFKRHGNEELLYRIIGTLQRAYLVGRSEDTRDEVPLIFTDDQGNLSYNKGALAMYALQEVLGEDTVNRALRNYLAKFAFKPPPFPTSRDLVNELRAVAGDEHQALITDWFEKIVLYDLELTDAKASKVDAGYEVELVIDARQLEADGRGAESEVPLHSSFDVALFGESTAPLIERKHMYLSKQPIKSGSNIVRVRVPEKPAYAAIDPFRKVPDRQPQNNGAPIR